MKAAKKNKCAWFLSDLEKVEKNGCKVFSTFSCGGGSSMGYKLAGFDVIGANDIDPEMAWHYQKNLKPKHYFLCPIKDLITAKLPDELFDLDILDGSPPCSTFSMAGSREKAWGKDKHFREGQAKQVLSDLFFDFLDLAERLQPKVVIAENVKGMILGNAKGYTKMVMARLKEIGYKPQLFLVNAADCGVPQTRQRVFFCALRNDIDKGKMELNPTHKWISAGEATSDLKKPSKKDLNNIATRMTGIDARYWHKTIPGKSYSTVANGSAFNHMKLSKNKPAPTLSGNAHVYTHWEQYRKITYKEFKRLGAFPDDYQAKTDKIGKYMIGMSVPPKMTEQVAKAVYEQWLK